MNTLRRIIASGVFGIAGLGLAAVAFIVLPIYGAAMLVWLHVAFFDILVTVGPLMVIFSVGAYATVRASMRACKGGT